EIPQGLVEPRQGGQQNRPSAVEAAAIGDLPDILDPEGVVAEETVAYRLEGAVDGFGMAFQARLAPACGAVVRFHPDEQPARRDIEGLDAADLHQGPTSGAVACAPTSRRRSSVLACRPTASTPCEREGGTIGTTRHTLWA